MNVFFRSLLSVLSHQENGQVWRFEDGIGYVYQYETPAGSEIEVDSNNVSGDLMVQFRICTTDFVLILHPSPKCTLAHFPTWISQCWKVPAANVYTRYNVFNHGRKCASAHFGEKGVESGHQLYILVFSLDNKYYVVWQNRAFWFKPELNSLFSYVLSHRLQ